MNASPTRVGPRQTECPSAANPRQPFVTVTDEATAQSPLPPAPDWLTLGLTLLNKEVEGVATGRDDIRQGSEAN